MFLKEKDGSHLVEVLSLNDLFNPIRQTVVGRFHHGEELQEAEQFGKQNLIFPSGEPLPNCWMDVHYRDKASQR